MTHRISASLLLFLGLVSLQVLGQPANPQSAAPQSADPQSLDPELLEQIQHQCLLAYTPEMLLELYGSEELPEQADDAETAINRMVDVIDLDKGRLYPFLLEDLAEAFETYVNPGTRFLDLGSGDGRVVFHAAALGAAATGIEYDPQIFAVSQRAREALGQRLARGEVELIQDDFFNHSWSGYDVIFYFDQGSFDQHRLRKKIFSELDPGARLIVGHQRVPFPGLELETTFKVLHIYRQAENLAEYNPKLKDQTFQEVRDIHAFLERWYNGEVEKTEDNLARYGNVLDLGYQAVDPHGAIIRRALALDTLRGTYGKWRDSAEPGKIEIANLELRFILDSLVAVTFDEYHSANNRTRRLKTTAVLRVRHGTPNGVEWLHTHQSDLRLVIVRED